MSGVQGAHRGHQPDALAVLLLGADILLNFAHVGDDARRGGRCGGFGHRVSSSIR